MKKLYVVLIIFVTMFMLTGCVSKENVIDSNALARLQKITGKIVKAYQDAYNLGKNIN